MSIRENYESIIETMERACARSGRKPEEVTLCGVSKYVDTDRMQEAYDAGVRLFGENHAQEIVAKKEFFERLHCPVHFIGQLQTNKIKYICGVVSMVESVDRENLLESLEGRYSRSDLETDILVQVNIGEEVQKGGIGEENLFGFCERILGCPHLHLRGLMCVPPAVDPEAARPYFARMRTLFEKVRDVCPGDRIDILSMGMSYDYAIAIEEGATIVRVGTALFGKRDRM